MAELIGLIVLIPAGVVALAALLTLLVYLIPGRVRRSSQILEKTPGRAFLIGLVNFIFFGLLAALLAQDGPFLRLIALLILLAMLALALVGTAGLVTLLRGRIYPVQEVSKPVVGQTVKSAVLLLMAFLAPVAGWFLMAPILIIMGLGTGIITLVRRGETAFEPSTQ